MINEAFHLPLAVLVRNDTLGDEDYLRDYVEWKQFFPTSQALSSSSTDTQNNVVSILVISKNEKGGKG